MRNPTEKLHRKSRWGRCILLPLLLLLFMFSGCQEEVEEDVQEPQIITVEIPEGAIRLYYLNEERTKVISEPYELRFDPADQQIADMLTALEAALWTEEEKDLILDRNPVQGFILNPETEVLTLYFAADYNATQGITSVLRRAAIVKTFCQLGKVSSVEVYIGSQPLLAANGKPVGMMKAEDFIDSTGENTEFYQETYAVVYFADSSGEHLVESSEKITYDGKVSTERLILNRLLEGPISPGMQAVIPEGTVLNKVTIKDGICYVDFNEKFLEKRDGISSEVAIYSVVNSLTDLPNVYRVQFLINGESRKKYQNLDFSSAFERNLEIVDGEQ